MENNNFTILDNENKKKKLKKVLKNRTQDCLTDIELDAILQSVKINRQYVIRLFFNAEEFWKVLTLPKLSKGKIIFGCARLGVKGKVGVLEDEAYPVVAIVTIREKRLENRIYIYLPKKKGEKKKSETEQESILCDGQCMKEKWICEHIQYRKETLYCDLRVKQEVKYAK